MDDMYAPKDPSSQAGSPAGQGQRVPYRRVVPHVTQAPITDESVRDFETRRSQGAHNTSPGLQSRPGRKHMGVATADPQYLPQNGPAHPRRTDPGDPNQHQRLHYERYLQTPRSKKSIFIARQERARRHAVIVVVAIVVLVILALWFIFFR